MEEFSFIHLVARYRRHFFEIADCRWREITLDRLELPLHHSPAGVFVDSLNSTSSLTSGLSLIVAVS
jgi:hypothetical protein